MVRKFLLSVLALLFSVFVFCQKPHQKSSAEIELALNKLNFLGSVLYVAAHPDDENTRLIAYFANEALANTAYLSMTRGDGGQNLIGPEIREYLGIIRTQELLAARRTDGGQQFFTRANDFGYSKSPKETQDIWERDEVLSDVVWTFRKFRPDVVITRFPTDGGGGHGHHTTSAILAHEAFDIAGDKSRFPEHLDTYTAWQPKRLYLNTGRWWNTSINEKSPGVITLDAGKYNELLGKSYSEIAAESRTQHKSQGFGSTGSRGYQPEFLEYRKGDQAEDDIFDGVNTTWTRVKGGEKVGEIVEEVISDFNTSNPAAIVPQLLKIRSEMLKLEDGYWKSVKLPEVDALIADCLGLYLEAKASDYISSPGEKVELQIEAINRSGISAKLKKVVVNNTSTEINSELKSNKVFNREFDFIIPENTPISQPYWLVSEGSLGMYKVEDRLLRGTPENSPSFSVTFTLDVEGSEVSYTKPLIYKWNDPVGGELYRPFVVAPPIHIDASEQILIFGNGAPKEIEVVLSSHLAGFKGTLKPILPKSWRIEPKSIGFTLEGRGKEERVKFKVFPPAGDSSGDLKFIVSNDGNEYNLGLNEINYDHIPIQAVFPESKTKLVKIDLKTQQRAIGYIHGAGDDIPGSLRNIGYEVWEMSDEEITPENLAKNDVVILGIRALNTRERLAIVMEDLLKYVEDGGTLLIQYNTTRGLKVENFAPYPLQLSRNRVTLENSEVSFVNKKLPALNFPNKIQQDDFTGWVQERGLYFPNKWDEKYQSVLSMADPGEKPTEGSILIAPYGKGTYIYTGISWFRELPAGVPGAYKLFVNLISDNNKGRSKSKSD